MVDSDSPSMSGKGARKEEILKGFKLYPSSSSLPEFNDTFADYFNLYHFVVSVLTNH